MEKDLNKIMMCESVHGKQTAAEWVMAQPEEYRELATEAICECMRKGWPLHKMHIQSTAKDIDAKRRPQDFRR